MYVCMYVCIYVCRYVGMYVRVHLHSILLFPSSSLFFHTHTHSPFPTLPFPNSCAGVADVLESETRKPLAELQKEDLFFLGRLIVMLATRSIITPQTFSQSLAMMAQYYSPDLHALAVQLCTKPPTVFDLAGVLSRYGRLIGR